MARMGVAAFYVALAVALGLLDTWTWVALILLAVVVPGVAVFYGAGLAGEFIAEVSRRRFDDGRGGPR